MADIWTWESAPFPKVKNLLALKLVVVETSDCSVICLGMTTAIDYSGFSGSNWNNHVQLACPAIRLKTPESTNWTVETCFWGLPDLNPFIVSLCLQYYRSPATQTGNTLPNVLWICSIRYFVLKPSWVRLTVSDGDAFFSKTICRTADLNTPLESWNNSMIRSEVRFLIWDKFWSCFRRNKSGHRFQLAINLLNFDQWFWTCFRDWIENPAPLRIVDLSLLLRTMLGLFVLPVVFEKSPSPSDT